MQDQIGELKEMVNILKNTVDELKTMVIDTISKKTETIYVPKLIGDKDIITGIIYLNPYTLEANIKSAFNNKYKLIAGKEYFEGDEKDIINDFVQIVNDYNNKIYCSDNIEKNI